MSEAVQMTIFDFVQPEVKPKVITSKCLQCKYHFFKHGKETGMGCDRADGCEFTARHTCGTCKYFHHYVCGLGDIYSGTACTVSAPFAKDVDENQDACDRWEVIPDEDARS